MVVEQWVEHGYHHILDFGSGLPTQGNIHEIASQAHIMYSDRDPVVVAYAQDLLQTTPTVQYIHGDARDPQPILAAATTFFGSERRVAIGCIGLAYFLDDAALSGLMQALYDWAAPGSSMALTQSYAEIITSDNHATLAAFKRSGAEMFLRNAAEISAKVAPWQVRAIKPLATWLNLENMLEESDRAGGNVDMFGLILERPE
jgi:O-methyltransferase involved in polyketide biosynthesis